MLGSMPVISPVKDNFTFVRSERLKHFFDHVLADNELFETMLMTDLSEKRVVEMRSDNYIGVTK